jgi:hypothetical protein
MADKARKTDQDYWRRVFIAGRMNLHELSKEQDAPAYGTLRKWAMATDDEPSWSDQRKQFRKNQEQKVASVPEIQDTVQRIEQIIDSAEMLARHAQASKLMGSIAMFELNAIRREQIETGKRVLSENMVERFLARAIEYERLTEGLATERQEMKVDLKGMSDAELQKIVDGNR